MSWWGQYQGESIGKIIHFLYHYCGFDVAEMATIGNEVKYHGKIISPTIDFEDQNVTLKTGEMILVRVPIFNFSDPYHAERQLTRREEAVNDLCVVLYSDVKRYPLDSFHKKY